MKRILSLFALGALSACAVAAQMTAPAQAGSSTNAQAGAQANASTPAATGSQSTKASASPSSSTTSKKGASPVTIAEGTKIDATLVSWLDARRSRIGDPVQARVEQDVKQGGKVVLKKGTQLAGHVTAARSSGKGESQIGLSFERAMLPNGDSMTFHASIVALSAPPTAPTGGTGAMMNTSNAASSAANGTTNADVRSSAAKGGQASSSRLSSNSKGVFGMEGLSLSSAKSSGAQGSMIVSTTKNVRLNSGTEMLLQTSTKAR